MFQGRIASIKGAAMKILVRDEQTGKYLGLGEDWVGDSNEAMEFGTIQKTGHAAARVEDSSVVLSDGNPQGELAIYPVYCV